MQDGRKQLKLEMCTKYTDTHALGTSLKRKSSYIISSCHNNRNPKIYLLQKILNLQN